MANPIGIGAFLETCFIKDLVDGTKLKFQFMPEEIGESREVNWEDVATAGRAFPIKGYAHSGATSISLNLQFHEDPGVVVGPVNIKSIIWYIRSMAAPDYSKVYISAAHPYLVSVGKFINMTGVLTSYSMSYKGPWNFETGLPKLVEASLAFSEVGDNLSASDVYGLRRQAGIGDTKNTEISRFGLGGR